MNMMTWLYVFIGGGLGSICRFALGIWIPLEPGGLPWPTIIANFFASLILGFLFALLQIEILPKSYVFLLMSGFCGGFSTFSTFSLESFELIANGHYLSGFGNILLSVFVGLVAIFAGIRLGAYFFD